jgi:hypothetical protein
MKPKHLLLTPIWLALFLAASYNGGQQHVIARWTAKGDRQPISTKKLKNPTSFGLKIDRAEIIKTKAGRYYLVRYGKYQGRYGTFSREVFISSKQEVMLESPALASGAACKPSSPSTTSACICDRAVGPGITILVPCGPWTKEGGCPGGCVVEADGQQQSGNCIEQMTISEPGGDIPEIETPI